jgi:hypothetical protein
MTRSGLIARVETGSKKEAACKASPLNNGEGSLMQYDILYDDVLDMLIAKVNHAIEDGWKPLGGTVVAGNQSMGSGNLFLQAVTNKSDVESP